MKTKESELLERAEWYQQQHQKLQLERDAARAEAEGWKQELTEVIRERNKTVADLVKQRNEERAHNEFTFTRRPEPSRLEIAAMLMAHGWADRSVEQDAKLTGWALAAADKLIAAAKENK